MTTPHPAPADQFASFLRWLSQAVMARTGVDLSSHLISLIIERLRLRIAWPVARIAARVAAGTYVRRHRAAPPRPPAGRRPRTPSALPTGFGWLVPLLPDGLGLRAQLDHLLHEPEMAALLAAAPLSLARPIRSLCWMLRLEPPAILAVKTKPRPPREKPPAAAPEPAAPQPPRPQPPSWMPRHRPWSLARIRGSPHRA